MHGEVEYLFVSLTPLLNSFREKIVNLPRSRLNPSPVLIWFTAGLDSAVLVGGAILPFSVLPVDAFPKLQSQDGFGRRRQLQKWAENGRNLYFKINPQCRDFSIWHDIPEAQSLPANDLEFGLPKFSALIDVESTVPASAIQDNLGIFWGCSVRTESDSIALTLISCNHPDVRRPGTDIGSQLTAISWRDQPALPGRHEIFSAFGRNAFLLEVHVTKGRSKPEHQILWTQVLEEFGTDSCFFIERADIAPDSIELHLKAPVIDEPIVWKLDSSECLPSELRSKSALLEWMMS